MLCCKRCSTSGHLMTERKTIRQLRQERGWTQETLARRLGVGQPAVSAWERGRHPPYPRHQRALADLFGVPVEAIAVGSAEPHPHAGTRQARP